MKKKCKSCNKELAGRSDKKFCGQLCKNHFHNGFRKNRSRRDAGLIAINRQILRHLTNEGITRIATDELAVSGFNFGDITGVEFVGKSGMKLQCHEFSLLKKGNGFLIMTGKN